MRDEILSKLSRTMMLVALVSSSSVFANCEQADMAGVWQLFYQGHSITLNISKTGDIDISQGPIKGLEATVGVIYDPEGDFYLKYVDVVGNWLNGKIEVSSDCRTVGYLRSEESLPLFIPEEPSYPELPPFYLNAPIEFTITNSRTRPDTQYWWGHYEIKYYEAFQPPDFPSSPVLFIEMRKDAAFKGVRILRY